MLTKQDLELLSEVIDKRLEPVIKGQNDIVKEQRAIRAEQKTMREEQKELKEELLSEILAARAEANANILDLGAKLTRKMHGYEQRLRNLEKHTGTTDPTKN